MADSSYLVEGLLKRKELFEEDTLFTLDLAVYEVANSIWKHEFLLKDIRSGSGYLSILQGLIESGKIQLLHVSKETLETAYSLASKKRHSIYDAAFISLALDLGLGLSTFDMRMAELFEKAAHYKS